jgi:hypothetical protein
MGDRVSGGHPIAGFGNSDLPLLFHRDDKAAVERQRAAVEWAGRQLVFLVVAAACSALPWRLRIGPVDLLALVSAGAYVGTLWFTWQIARHDHKANWQLHRSAAELLRSQCWRYAVCGAPFGSDIADPDGVFEVRLTESLNRLRSIGWPDPRLPRPGQVRDLITPAMRELRSKPFAVRRGVYVRDRLIEQRDWYHRRAAESRRASARWQALAVAGTIAALCAAAAKTYGWGTSVDLVGLASSAAASCVAWSELRQYRPLVVAHAEVAQELGSLAAVMGKTVVEARWAAQVDTAEEAISPERTAWLTRHRS